MTLGTHVRLPHLHTLFIRLYSSCSCSHQHHSTVSHFPQVPLCCASVGILAVPSAILTHTPAQKCKGVHTLWSKAGWEPGDVPSPFHSVGAHGVELCLPTDVVRSLTHPGFNFPCFHVSGLLVPPSTQALLLGSDFWGKRGSDR